MSWLRIEGKMPQHQKVSPLSDSAFRLHVTAMAWSAEFHTDGRIPGEVVSGLTRAPSGKRLAAIIEELAKAKLWHVLEDGFEIHDYLQWNMSAVDYQRKSEAGSIGGKARASRVQARAYKVLNDSSTTGQAVSVSVSVSDLNPEESLRSKDLTGTSAPGTEDSTRPVLIHPAKRMEDTFNTLCPDSIVFTEVHRNFASKCGSTVAEMWAEFRAKRRAKGVKAANPVGWQDDFEGWLRTFARNEQKRSLERGTAPRVNETPGRGRIDSGATERHSVIPSWKLLEDAKANLPAPGPMTPERQAEIDKKAMEYVLRQREKKSKGQR